jgi:uncharacterized protein YbjT (DUF2867 family)
VLDLRLSYLIRLTLNIARRLRSLIVPKSLPHSTMARNLPPTALVGCTGLVVSRSASIYVFPCLLFCQGSHILSTLVSLSPTPSTIHAITRRSLPSKDPAIHPVTELDSSKWPETLKKLEPAPKIFISALGTTKTQAGSFEAQRAIDYDLNLALARTAKENGATIYVLISAAKTSTTSPFPYVRMKAELEEAVKALEIPYTILVRPGMLVGDRSDSRPAEAIFRNVAKGLGAISKRWLTDWWAQDADVIGKAAVAAALQCHESKRQPGLWLLEQCDIIKLGRTDWKNAA